MYLEGEYSLSDLYIGVPCEIGKGGIEKIVELDISTDEKAALAKSAQAIKALNKLLQ